MATETLEALIRLRDELTKPLTDQQKALKKVTEQIKTMQKATVAADREQKKHLDLMKQQRTEQIKTMQKATVAADREQKKHLDLMKQQRKNTLDLIPGVSKLTGNMEKFGGGMGMAVTAAGATVIAVAAVVAVASMLAVAVAATTVKILEITSAEVDWANKTKAMFAVMDRAGGSGAAQLKIVTDMAKLKGVALQSIASTAQELLDSGVRNGRELQQSLEAVTDLQAAGNEPMAGHLKELIKRAGAAREGFKGQDTWAGTAMFSATELQKAGTNVEDFYAELSKIKGRPVTAWLMATGQIRASSKEMIKALSQAVHTRVGPIAEKAWTLERIKNSWAATWTDMVKGIDFGPLYTALRGLIRIFDPLNASGELTSAGITTAVNKIVEGVAWMVTKVTIGILDLRIAFLEWYIKGVLLWNQFAEMVNNNAEIINLALTGIKIVLLVIAAAFAVVIGAVVGFYVIMIATITAVVLAIGSFVDAIKDVWGALSDWGPKALEAAANLIDGLVNGIRSGIGLVVSAVKDLGGGAVSALKNVLGIHSPSKVFEQAGMFSGLGFEQGLTKSMSGIDVGMPSVSMGGVSGGGQPGSIQLGGLTVNIGGVEKAEQIVPNMIPALADMLEQVMLEWGH